MTAVEARSFLATATREELVERVLADADRVAAAEGRVREVIGERERAVADREAALDLAEQYARMAGVDVSRDALLKGVAAWWEQVARRERAHEELEAQRWDVQRFALYLTEQVGDVDLSGREVAQRVGERLSALFSAQGRAPSRTRTAELFARPEPPVA